MSREQSSSTARRPRLSRAQRFAQRHDGPRRVLWFLTYGQTGHTDQGNAQDVQCLWIRYAGGFQECLPLPLRPLETFRMLAWSTGQLQDLPQPVREVFAEYVAPRIPPEQQARAFKVELTPHILRTTGLRDHPFTPGVREFYELATRFSATSTLPRTGHYAPARYRRFTTRQDRTRVQLGGTRLLLLAQGRLWNISAGRLPQDVELSAEVKGGIRALAWELARRTLSPAQLRHLAVYAARHPDLCALLRAIRFPAFLTVPVLLEHAKFATGSERRRLLRYRGGVKPYLRQLVGSLPRATHLLTGPDRLHFARALHRSGMTSPDLKAALVRAIPAHSEGLVPHGLDFGWLIAQDGEQVAAERLMRDLQGGHRVNVAPAPQRPTLWPQTARPGFARRPANRLAGWFRGVSQALPFKRPIRQRGFFPVAGGPGRLVEHLHDIDQLRQEIQITQPDFTLPRGTVQEVHDTLARVHRRLQQENRPIPSATDPKHARLDQSLLCPTFGLLQFRRARCTHDLVDVSEGLHNCVSGYARPALRGEVIIVVARDAQNVPRACLEIRNQHVVQYKLDHNAPSSTAADAQTAAAYVQLAGLGIGGSDLRAALKASGAAVTLPPVVLTPDPLDLPF